MTSDEYLDAYLHSLPATLQKQAARLPKAELHDAAREQDFRVNGWRPLADDARAADAELCDLRKQSV
jgi:hypothetical protein